MFLHRLIQEPLVLVLVNPKSWEKRNHHWSKEWKDFSKRDTTIEWSATNQCFASFVSFLYSPGNGSRAQCRQLDLGLQPRTSRDTRVLPLPGEWWTLKLTSSYHCYLPPGAHTKTQVPACSLWLSRVSCVSPHIGLQSLLGLGWQGPFFFSSVRRLWKMWDTISLWSAFILQGWIYLNSLPAYNGFLFTLATMQCMQNAPLVQLFCVLWLQIKYFK